MYIIFFVTIISEVIVIAELPISNQTFLAMAIWIDCLSFLKTNCNHLRQGQFVTISHFKLKPAGQLVKTVKSCEIERLILLFER